MRKRSGLKIEELKIGKYGAIVFDRYFGSAGGHATHLSILNKAVNLGRSGNTAVFDGFLTIDLNWKDDMNLEVTHDATAKVYPL